MKALRRLTLAAGLVGLSLFAAACGQGPPPGGRVVPVQRQDLVIDVVVTGTLRSLQSERIGPSSAAASQWRFKIIRMLPEGTKVAPGTEVIAFDPSDLEKRLKDAESDVASATEELGKLRADNALKTVADRQTLEEARATQRKAELKADKPEDLTQQRERMLYAIDRTLAQHEVQFQHDRERAKRLEEASDVAILKTRLARAEERVAEAKAELSAMSIKARRAGTVIYKENWRGEKSKLGDDLGRASTPLEIASLTEMAAQGQVDEVDASSITIGQRVGLRLEAHPDREYAGVVERVANLVQTESPESRNKVVQLDIKLTETDPLLMRPGMRFRGRIEIARIPGVLQVPLAAIESTASGPVVTRVGGRAPAAPQPVQLGRRGRDSVEVVKGLQAGEQVLLRAAESSERPEGAPGQGQGAFRLGAS
jgi:hypothetical protein